jgi:small subunit ribosomal protein S1
MAQAGDEEPTSEEPNREQPANVPLPPPTGGAGPRPVRHGSAGKIVEGVVTSVSSDEVELTLDDGRPAVISSRNFANDNTEPTEVLSPGDRAFGAELAREDPKNRVVLSRAWALKRRAWESIVQAASQNESVTGRVVSLGAKGVVVDAGVRGFVPTSHLDLEIPKDLTPYLDQVLELKVLEADPQRERLVLSRRSLLLREQRRKAQELLASLRPGETHRGKVTSITDYGAFVDIGGVNGLVHLSELSWRRVRDAREVVSLGQEVEVQVLDVKVKKRRISLSIRRLAPDPLSELEVGQIHQGPVTRLVDFGAFVALGEVEGLVHLSELAEYRVSAPEQVVAPGEEVRVKILSVDPGRRRVELSIRQAAEFGG